ncbi:unnamed protein product, partial [Vitis vinifera]|uniref:Uncharacterized protein n=1 Tax=Vitis vinifera TaxID=29760 RepID=D7SS48_VITVI
MRKMLAKNKNKKMQGLGNKNRWSKRTWSWFWGRLGHNTHINCSEDAFQLLELLLFLSPFLPYQTLEIHS